MFSENLYLDIRNDTFNIQTYNLSNNQQRFGFYYYNLLFYIVNLF